MASTVRASMAFAFVASLAVVLAGCGDDGNNGAAAGTSSASGTSSGTALSISGSPTASVMAGTDYSFQPAAGDVAGAKLSFVIKNQPAWATFDAATGALSGSPTAANVGSYAQIQISVSDGVATSTLAPFSISVIPATGKTNLTISGTAPPSATVGSPYSFRPTAGDAAGATLTFAIGNKPAWASFDTATGALSGTPGSGNVGTDADIVISVSDGTHSSALTAFSISVDASTESVTLYWTAPSTNANGTAVTDLAGYHIYYGPSAASMTTVITVNNAGDTSQVIRNLKAGTWYFAVTSFNGDNIESRFSAVLPLTI